MKLNAFQRLTESDINDFAKVFTKPSCKHCGAVKTLHDGMCMDCADEYWDKFMRQSCETNA